MAAILVIDCGRWRCVPGGTPAFDASRQGVSSVAPIAAGSRKTVSAAKLQRDQYGKATAV
jgi:hypothetical protein